MNDEKVFLKELILALNYAGLDWQLIMEDYIECRLEKGCISFQDKSNIEAIISYVGHL